MKTFTNYHVVIKQQSKRFLFFISIFILVSVFSEKTSAQEYAIIPNTSLTEGDGSWIDGWEVRACNNQGATIKVSFYGTGVRWNGKRYGDGGTVSVFVDGIDKGSFTISSMSANDNDIVHYDIVGLPLGNHELTLTQTTSNTWINYSRFQNLSTTLTRNGDGWGTNGPIFNYCLNSGSSVIVDFVGNGISWFGERYNDAGITTFAIDGGVAEDVDAYGSQNQVPISWEKRGLSNGNHTLVCTVSGRKNSASSGIVFNYLYFEPIYDNTTQINQISSKNIQLFGNKINFTSELNNQQIKLLIYNSLGQVIYSKCILISGNQIELPQLNGLNAIVVLNSTNQSIFNAKIIH